MLCVVVSFCPAAIDQTHKHQTNKKDCDTCKMNCMAEDPLGGVIQWGYKRKVATAVLPGRQCYGCRRVHRGDAILASIMWVGIGVRSREY